MTPSPAAGAVVITSSSPGVARWCLSRAGVPHDVTAVLTSPGAGLANLGGQLGRHLAAAIGLTGARQILVIAYDRDPVYRLGAEGLSGRAGQHGVRLGRSGWGRELQLPGIDESAADTVELSVAALSECDWLPRGTTLMGMVVDRDGAVETVALDVLGGGTAAPAQPPPAVEAPRRRARTAPPESPATPPPAERRSAPARPVEADEELADPFANLPVSDPFDEGNEHGERTSGGPLASGPAVSGGGQPDPIGPVTSGSQGPLDGGASVFDGAGPRLLGQRDDDATGGLGDLSSGPLGGGRSVFGVGPAGLAGGGARAMGSVDGGEMSGAAPLSAPERDGDLDWDAATVDVTELEQGVEVDVGGIRPIDDGEDLLERWLSGQGRPATERTPRPEARAPAGSREPPHRAPPRGAPDDDQLSLEQRLERSTLVLHDFLERHAASQPQRREMRYMLRAGASPEGVLRVLDALIRSEARDRMDVRAALGTVQMAQTQIGRRQLEGVLRKIVL